MERVSVWKISVAGYGTFSYVGTEAQAEEMRRHKASWEQGVGKKERLREAKASEVFEWRKKGPFSPEETS